MIPSFLIFIFQILFVPALSPLVVGVIRKIKAWMQNREGAGIFQPYRDVIKLLHKDEVISEDASWVFRFAPYLVFAVTLVLAAGLPIVNASITFYPLGDFLVFIYLLTLGTFFLALSGMDAGSSFGGFGSSREMTVAALTEGGLLFSFLAVALTTKTTNLAEMVLVLKSFPHVFYPQFFIAFFAFLIAMIAETSRMPIDNPATHLELTMIHEAMILEYSGKRLALMEWASANKLLIFIALGSNLFLPWGVAEGYALDTFLLALILFFIKTFILASGIAVLESSIAKLRFFRIPDLLLTSLILGIIAVAIIII